MDYITREDIEGRIPTDELTMTTDDDANSQVPDNALLDTFIADTNALINTYLRGRYTLPLTEVPEELIAPAVAIVRYKLRSRTESVTQEITDGYNAAISWLKDIAAGRASLEIAEEDEPIPQRKRFATNTRTRKFGPETFAKY